MAFLSYNLIRERRQSVHFSNARVLAEAKAETASGAVFLSHSSKDDEQVEGVVMFLRDFGVRVYTDNHDARLPNPPSVETAKTLKGEIRDASRFVVLVSPNSRSSRWIPWELGLADGFKGIVPVALLPITQNGDEESWAREEYFALYPRIFRSDNTWKVMDPRDQVPWLLQNWLTKTL